MSNMYIIVSFFGERVLIFHSEIKSKHLLSGKKKRKNQGKNPNFRNQKVNFDFQKEKTFRGKRNH